MALFDRIRLARSVVAGLAIHGDRVLLMRGRLPGAEDAWWHAPVARLDLGMRARDRVSHAFREEVGCDAVAVDLMGESQQPFEVAGVVGREMLFTYFARLVEPAATLLPRADGSTPGDRQDLAWLPLTEVTSGAYRIAPDGVVERLTAWLDRLEAIPSSATDAAQGRLERL